MRFKKYLVRHPEFQVRQSISAEIGEHNREIDEFGELAVKKIRRAQKRLSPEEVKMLIAEYLAGKEPQELGDQFGIHRITASKILKRNGIPLRRTYARSPIK